MRYAEAFLLGLFQITAIALNTWQVAASKVEGAMAVQVVISGMWVLGVKSVVEGNWRTRAVYVAGCACGQPVGIWIAHRVWGG